MALSSDILHSAGLHNLAETILLSIVISTILSEGIGAIGTSFSINRAGEEGEAGASRSPKLNLEIPEDQ